MSLTFISAVLAVWMLDMPSSEVKLPVIVLAGAPADDEMRARYSVEWSAAMPFAGKPMVQHVVNALRASSHVESICLVGNIECDGVTHRVAPRGSFLANTLVGIEACGGKGRVLISTSDIPFLTPEAVDDFIERCGSLQADFYYSVVSKEAVEKRFPGMKRTCARLKEGTFTGGNIVIMDSEFLIRNAEFLDGILAARKNVIRLARLIGLVVLLRALVAQVLWPRALSLPHLEKTVGRILKARVRAVVTPYAEIGADADTPEHVEAMLRMADG